MHTILADFTGTKTRLGHAKGPEIWRLMRTKKILHDFHAFWWHIWLDADKTSADLLLLDSMLTFCCISNRFKFTWFSNKQSMINILVTLVASKHTPCNAHWEEAEQRLICLLLFSVTHSKVMQGASLLELFHINKHIPAYLLSAESQAAHHIREPSSNGGVRALFLCTHLQETQNSTHKGRHPTHLQ